MEGREEEEESVMEAEPGTDDEAVNDAEDERAGEVEDAPPEEDEIVTRRGQAVRTAQGSKRGRSEEAPAEGDVSSSSDAEVVERTGKRHGSEKSTATKWRQERGTVQRDTSQQGHKKGRSSNRQQSGMQHAARSGEVGQMRHSEHGSTSGGPWTSGSESGDGVAHGRVPAAQPKRGRKVCAPRDSNEDAENSAAEQDELGTRHGENAVQRDAAAASSAEQLGERHAASPRAEEQHSAEGRQSVGEARRERTRRERKRAEYPGMVGEQPPRKRGKKRGPTTKRPRAGVQAHGGELRHLIRVGHIVIERIETDEDSRAKRRRR